MLRKRKKLYLDVDGVLLRENQRGEYGLISGIEDFLRYTRKNFDCYWLTTHGRHSVEHVKKYLAPYFKKAGLDLALIEHIKAVPWNTLKTEAIDFSSSFIWMDDDPFPSEIEVLRKKSLENCILIVNKEQDLLEQIKNFIKSV